jgi:hypothetical protein
VGDWRPEVMDGTIKANRWLLAAGLTELIYGLGEIVDTLYLLFLQARLLPNIYPAWTFSEINHLMIDQPIILFPVFAFFAIGRLVASLGVLRNRLWGFWLSLIVSLVTMFWAVFFLPLGGIDLLTSLFIVSALLVGRLGSGFIIPSMKGNI